MYDNQALTLYGGVERMRANVAVSQAAHAEASGRVTRARVGIAAARVNRSGRREREAVTACRAVSRLAGRRVRAHNDNGRARRQSRPEP
jgi:hypothetical protein